MPEENKPWMIRDMPDRSRRLVKRFAVEQDVTIAGALEFIIDAMLTDRGMLASRVMRLLNYYERTYGDTLDMHTAWRLAAEMRDIEDEHEHELIKVAQDYHEGKGKLK